MLPEIARFGGKNGVVQSCHWWASLFAVVLPLAVNVSKLRSRILFGLALPELFVLLKTG